jgi:succinyl-CoA synthetase beta subunit
VSNIIEKMYHLFLEKDLDLVEINPLGINADGEVMALDGKIDINDYALERHRDLLTLMTSKKEQTEEFSLDFKPNLPLQFTPSVEPRWLDGIDEKGTIGIISNSVGLALATWDILIQEKGKPSCCLLVEESLATDSLTQKLERALEKMMSLSHIKVILVNWIASQAVVESSLEAIAYYLGHQHEPTAILKGEERITRATGSILTSRERSFKTRSQKQPSTNPPQIVLRFAGKNLDAESELLTTIPIHWTQTLEQAVMQALSFAKGK